ncbi:MAG: GIY-YIG nuclease family protein, partial [candidate division Zixibacteria bacterium]|nr:GIY-YIG nuclease family protein [candidate division Zixibacteria bacterium]
MTDTQIITAGLSLKGKLAGLPSQPGVYLFKDARGKVIYVGKAIALRKRVQSYFRKSHGALSKTDLLVSEIDDIDTIETDSEAEALILEASLIKKYGPKYNVELKDDKSYPVIEITGEIFPRISVVRPASLAHHPEHSLEPAERRSQRVERPHKKKKNATYFGPYVNPGLIREALTIIRKIFPFRTCNPFPNKECLDYHIGLCDAPCIDKIGKREYLKNVRNVRLILEGKRDLLYQKLKKEMESLASAQKFEEAAKIRDQLRAIGALYSGTKDINYYKEAEQLQRALGLPRLPERIETFDIS